MKKLLLSIILILFATIEFSAQCPEADRQEFSKVLVKKTFQIPKTGKQNEQVLTLDAFTEGSSWQKSGAESGAVTIFVDGKYNQDILLFNGSTKFRYQVLLGQFDVGNHRLEIVFNPKRSAEKIGAVRILATTVKPKTSLTPSDAIAIVNAPFLYYRPETIDKFSDIPLLTYYEILPGVGGTERIVYTSIFTNEDGGTQTAALLARWGRTTDIEWVYEIGLKSGNIVSQILQGANHVTKSFSGTRVFGSHPLIFDVTVNNNFSDQGCSDLRTALLPMKADLSKASRETVMDENPWTYRIMAQEAIREGRIDPANLGENTIADLRDYIFAEVRNGQSNTAIAIAAVGTDGKTYTSDNGNRFMRVDRTGYARIALRFPRQVRGRNTKFSILCNSRIGERLSCNDVDLLKAVSLNDAFGPVNHRAFRIGRQQNSSGDEEFLIKWK